MGITLVLAALAATAIPSAQQYGSPVRTQAEKIKLLSTTPRSMMTRLGIFATRPKRLLSEGTSARTVFPEGITGLIAYDVDSSMILIGDDISRADWKSKIALLDVPDASILVELQAMRVEFDGCESWGVRLLGEPIVIAVSGNGAGTFANCAQDGWELKVDLRLNQDKTISARGSIEIGGKGGKRLESFIKIVSIGTALLAGATDSMDEDMTEIVRRGEIPLRGLPFSATYILARAFLPGELPIISR